MTDQYKKAGVNIDAGNEFVENIKPLIAKTKRRGVISSIGGFGGLFAPDLSDMKEPVLVSGTDGVGTKLKVAIEMGKLSTIGIDLVAMCVNDIACTGAEPLFFLDYFATPKLKPTEHTEIIKGIAAACKETKCALIGGETAEMPELYAENDFDLAGFAVGIVDRSKIIDGSGTSAGDKIIGLTSSGFHSNGYALVRKIVRDAKLDLAKIYTGFDRTLGELLLEPTKLYSPVIAKLKNQFTIKGIAHITGGGFYDNIPRILPAGVQAVIDKSAWELPPLFKFFAEHGNVDEKELFRVFNCGIGMVIVVPEDEANSAMEAIKAQKFDAFIIGKTMQCKENDPAVVL